MDVNAILRVLCSQSYNQVFVLNLSLKYRKTCVSNYITVVKIKAKHCILFGVCLLVYESEVAAL